MILELNEVLLKDEPQTLSMMAKSGELTCMTGGTSVQRRRWLYALMGFESLLNGFISIDGEPLTTRSALAFRQLMAFAPSCLAPVGEVVVYEAPTVQDVFSLKANREQPISNGILGEEIRRVGLDNTDPRGQLLAVAVLLGKPILLVDDPNDQAVGYIRHQANLGKLVIVTSDSPAVADAADLVVEL